MVNVGGATNVQIIGDFCLQTSTGTKWWWCCVRCGLYMHWKNRKLWLMQKKSSFFNTDVKFVLCRCYIVVVNPFQSNFSANRILPSSYIPAIYLQAQPRKCNAQSPVHIKTHGRPRNRKSTTCAICWPKSVLHEEKHWSGSDSGAGATKTCRTSSDIRAAQENHNVRRGLT